MILALLNILVIGVVMMLQLGRTFCQLSKAAMNLALKITKQASENKIKASLR
jgi:hypothetical protein